MIRLDFGWLVGMVVRSRGSMVCVLDIVGIESGRGC